jgi:hypothetical protein
MTPERITPEEMRAFMAATTEALEALRADLDQMRAGLQTASQPAPAGKTAAFIADEISFDHIEGKAVYKLRGPEYRKFGVRVWDETLPALGIQVTELKPGISKLAAPINVLVKLKETKDETTGEIKVVPQKVIGKA